MSISRNKPLIFIIVILLLTNIAVLVYFLRPGGNKGNKERTGGKIGIATPLKEEVGFSEAQMDTYKKLKEEQFKIMRPMMEDIRRTKDSMFSHLGGNPSADSLVARLAGNIAMKQKEMDIEAFNHFRRIRQLCTPEQLPKYDSMITRVIRKMGKMGKGDQKEARK